MRSSSGIRYLLSEQGPLLALIGVICLAFGAQLMLGEEAYYRFMAVPDQVVSASDSLREGHFEWMAFITLLSHAFLHGGADHLLFNMLFLWIFAALAAELIGHRWMLLTFLITAICGGICHVAMNPAETIPMLGASGAVTGFEGLYLGMATRWYLPDPHIWPMARPIAPVQLAMLGIMGVAMDLMGIVGGAQGVAHGAHLGGFVGGLLLGALVVPMPRLAHRR